MPDYIRHLVILTPGFPKNEDDDTCIPFQQALLLQLRRSFPLLKITVIAFEYPYHSQPYSWFGIPVIPFNGRNKGGLIRIWKRKRIISFLQKLDKKEKINGLLGFWYGECAATGELFSRKRSIKHFCWLWGQDARLFNKYPQKIHIPGERIIALSDFLQEEFEKNHGIKPARVITPGIVKQQHPVAKEKTIDILAAGSLIPLKRYDLFMEVLAEIKQKVPTVRAMLIGDGPGREKLEYLKKRLGLDENLVMTGELPHRAVLEKMSECTVFLHTSSYEGFVMVCLEALYAGAVVCSFVQPMHRPIINWQVAGTKEEMIEKTLAILDAPRVTQPPDPFPLEHTVIELMDLFT